MTNDADRKCAQCGGPSIGLVCIVCTTMDNFRRREMEEFRRRVFFRWMTVAVAVALAAVILTRLIIFPAN